MNPTATGILIEGIRKLVGKETADGVLLSRYVECGDESAFATLMRRHGPLVWAVCRRQLSHHDAEDVFQASFLVFARKAASIRRSQSLASWLYGVANRTARKLLVTRSRSQPFVDPPSEAHSPCAEASLHEFQAILDEEVERLPEIYRVPFILCCLQGKSKPEAAAELGWKEGTLSGRLARARQRLQGQLTRRGIRLSAALTATALTQASASAVPAGLTAAIVRRTVAPPVAALAQAVLAGSSFRPLLVVTLLLGLLTGGGGLSMLPVKDPAPPQAQPAVALPDVVQPRVDVHGDPLPEGALARLGTLRWRVIDSVTDLAFTPDGKAVVTAGSTTGISLWEWTTGRLLRRIRDERIRVNATALLPDGRTVAAATSDNRIRLLDAITGEERSFWDVRMEKDRNWPVLILAASPTGKLLAAAAAGAGVVETIKVWDLESQTELWSGRTGTIDVTGLAFSPDGKTLAAGLRKKGLLLWEAATGRPRPLTVAPAIRVITSLAFAPDGKLLALGGDKSVCLWDPATMRTVQEMSQLEDPVRALTFSPDGKQLAVGGAKAGAWLWDVATGREVRRFAPLGIPIRKLRFTPDGRHLLVASGSVIRIWEVATGASLGSLSGHDDPVVSVSLSPDGKLAATTGDDQSVRLWDARTGKELRRLPEGTGVALFLPDGQRFITGSNEEVHLWRVATGELQRSFRGSSGHIWAWALSRDGGLLVRAQGVQSLDKVSISIYNISTNKEVRRLPSPSIRSLALSPNGKLLALGGMMPLGSSGSRQLAPLSLWDVASGKELWKQLAHRFTVTSADFSPDGKLLVTSGDSDGLCLWDVATGKRLEHWKDMAWQPQMIRFSPDGRTLAAATPRGDIHLLEMLTRKEFGLLKGHEAAVVSMTFARDGRTLVSGGWDTTALVWDLTGRQTADGLQRAKLTAQELEAHWTDLGSDDARTAYRALWALAAAPEQALKLLHERLRPAGPLSRSC